MNGYQRSFAALLLIAAGAIAGSAARESHADEGIYIDSTRYAAIAYSPSTGEFRVARNYRSRSAAEKAALDACQAEDAEIACWVNDGFCALALGDDRSKWGVGWRWGEGASNQRAMDTALAECNKRTTNARIVVCVSSDGQYLYKPVQSPWLGKQEAATKSNDLFNPEPSVTP